MYKICKKENFSKVVLVSGDGGYKRLVDFLISENRLKKILFPARKNYSSLYKKLGSEYYDFMDNFKESVKIK